MVMGKSKKFKANAGGREVATREAASSKSSGNTKATKVTDSADRKQNDAAETPVKKRKKGEFQLLKDLGSSLEDLNLIFEDLVIDIGSKIPIFGFRNKGGPTVVVRVVEHKINFIFTGYDRELHDVLKAISVVNNSEIVKCETIKKTEKVTELEGVEFGRSRKYAKFSVEDTAGSIVAFYKFNKIKLGHNYWMIRDDNLVKLYDLTSISEECSQDKTESFKPNDGTAFVEKNPILRLPFRSDVAFLYFRIAKALWVSSVKTENYMRIKYLATISHYLIDRYRFPKVFAQCLFILCVIYFPMVKRSLSWLEDIKEWDEDKQQHQSGRVKSRTRMKMELERSEQVLLDQRYLMKHEGISSDDSQNCDSSINFAVRCFKFLIEKLKKQKKVLKQVPKSASKDDEQEPKADVTKVEASDNTSDSTSDNTSDNTSDSTSDSTSDQGSNQDDDKYLYMLKQFLGEMEENEEVMVEEISPKNVPSLDTLLKLMESRQPPKKTNKIWGKNLAPHSSRITKHSEDRRIKTKVKSRKGTLGSVEVSDNLNASIYEVVNDECSHLVPLTEIRKVDWNGAGWEGRMAYKLLSKLSFLYEFKAKETLKCQEVKLSLQYMEVSNRSWLAMLRAMKLEYQMPASSRFVTGEIYLESTVKEVYSLFFSPLRSDEELEIRTIHEILDYYVPVDDETWELIVPCDYRQGILLAYKYFTIGFNSDSVEVASLEYYKRKYATTIVEIAYSLAKHYYCLKKLTKNGKKVGVRHKVVFKKCRILLKKAIQYFEEVSVEDSSFPVSKKFRFHACRSRLLSSMAMEEKMPKDAQLYTHRLGFLHKAAMCDFMDGLNFVLESPRSMAQAGVFPFVEDYVQNLISFSFILTDSHMHTKGVKIMLIKAIDLIKSYEQSQNHSNRLKKRAAFIHQTLSGIFAEEYRISRLPNALLEAEKHLRKELDLLYAVEPSRVYILDRYNSYLSLLKDHLDGDSKNNPYHYGTYLTMLKAVIVCAYCLKLNELGTEEDTLVTGKDEGINTNFDRNLEQIKSSFEDYMSHSLKEEGDEQSIPERCETLAKLNTGSPVKSPEAQVPSGKLIRDILPEHLKSKHPPKVKSEEELDRVETEDDFVPVLNMEQFELLKQMLPFCETALAEQESEIMASKDPPLPSTETITEEAKGEVEESASDSNKKQEIDDGKKELDSEKSSPEQESSKEEEQQPEGAMKTPDSKTDETGSPEKYLVEHHKAQRIFNAITAGKSGKSDELTLEEAKCGWKTIKEALEYLNKATYGNMNTKLKENKRFTQELVLFYGHIISIAEDLLAHVTRHKKESAKFAHIVKKICSEILGCKKKTVVQFLVEKIPVLDELIRKLPSLPKRTAVVVFETSC